MINKRKAIIYNGMLMEYEGIEIVLLFSSLIRFKRYRILNNPEEAHDENARMLSENPH